MKQTFYELFFIKHIPTIELLQLEFNFIGQFLLYNSIQFFSIKYKAQSYGRKYKGKPLNPDEKHKPKSILQGTIKEWHRRINTFDIHVFKTKIDLAQCWWDLYLTNTYNHQTFSSVIHTYLHVKWNE